jgi:hypothetical protein
MSSLAVAHKKIFFHLLEARAVARKGGLEFANVIEEDLLVRVRLLDLCACVYGYLYEFICNSTQEYKPSTPSVPVCMRASLCV